MIQVTTAKRNVVVAVPMHTKLLEAVGASPRHDAVTIGSNSNGQPWTVSGFDSTFCKAIRKLEGGGEGGNGLTMQGLRHTLGTRLREAGAELDDIRRILGQKTLVMAQHYSETADTSDKAGKGSRSST